MKHVTAIDTIAMNIKFDNELECNTAIETIVALLEKHNYHINNEDDKFIEIEYKYKEVATIRKGSFSFTTKDKKKANKRWMLLVKLAGLKRFTAWLDIASHNCLLIMVSYFNTKKLSMDITQLDVALNIFTKFENIAVLCTKKMPNTDYYESSDKQPFKTTRYIEKFSSKAKQKDAVLRSSVYYKTDKNKLKFPLTRYELSLQKQWFKNNGLNVGLIYREFQRYHVLYIPNKKKQQKIIEEYESKDIIREKDIKDMRIELNRLHINVKVIMDFVWKLYAVNDETLQYHLLPQYK